jgi:hypothetical protein
MELQRLEDRHKFETDRSELLKQLSRRRAAAANADVKNQEEELEVGHALGRADGTVMVNFGNEDGNVFSRYDPELMKAADILEANLTKSKEEKLKEISRSNIALIRQDSLTLHPSQTYLLGYHQEANMTFIVPDSAGIPQSLKSHVEILSARSEFWRSFFGFHPKGVISEVPIEDLSFEEFCIMLQVTATMSLLHSNTSPSSFIKTSSKSHWI